MSWNPILGRAFDKFKVTINKKIDDKDFELLKNDNLKLLSQCIDPNNRSSLTTKLSTGLALGLIQSGKTSSMELLSNLAKDNGFKLIIIMSGTVGVLTKQTQERLYRSLNGIGWKRIHIPGPEERLLIDKSSEEILDAFNTWENDIFKTSEKRSVVIVTMKNGPRLKKLIRILNSINNIDPNILKNIPTLIIDDECDHASLNTQANREDNDESDQNEEIALAPEYAIFQNETIDEFLEKNGIEEYDLIRLNSDISSLEDLTQGMRLRISDYESATHRRIKLLRKYLPFSSYVGYTATPFANLLINTLTNLSPNFAQILSPGQTYNGSDYFFGNENNQNLYVRNIYRKEIEHLDDFGDFPPSLKKALRIFIIGISKGILQEDHLKNNCRSMFIHTAAEVSSLSGGNLSHENMYSLIRNDIEQLKKRFKDYRLNNDKIIIKEDIQDFKEAYEDLFDNISNFDNQFLFIIEKSLYFIDIIEFNARGKLTIPIIQWYDEGYGRILIGGHGLDRGYTIEGLTVSYLLRNTSVQRDTSLQRARFLGYHQSKLDFFRIFLPEPSRSFFTETNEIEKHMRSSLNEHVLKKQNLKLWPRIFLSTNNDQYSLTNPRRIHYTFVRNKKFFQVVYDSRQHDLSKDDLTMNQSLRKLLLDIAKPISELNSPRVYVGNLDHKVVLSKNIKFIVDMLDENLVKFSLSGYNQFQTISYFLKNYIKENPNQSVHMCPIILMNDIRQIDGNKMYRTVNEDNNTIVIQSNRSGEDYDKDKLVHYDYLMDENFPDEFAKNFPTLQIYNFKINYHDNQPSKTDVPFFIFYMPEKMFGDFEPNIAIPRS